MEWIWSIFYAAFAAASATLYPQFRDLFSTVIRRRRALEKLKPELLIRVLIAIVVDLAYCHQEGPPNVFLSMSIGAAAVGFVGAITKH